MPNEERTSRPLPLHPIGPPAGQRAHLVGVAGSGMRALAEVLLGRGWQLSGSDLSVASLEHLAQRGVELRSGHDAAHLPPQTDLVVHSDAVPADNPELRRAKSLAIPTLSYFEMLGRLASDCHTVAVAGTHGKSTATAMAARILIDAGRNPTVCCGAAPLGQWSGGRAGDDGLLLVEACEYRANFLHLRPRHAAILGIEPDHFDCFPTPESLEAAFTRFARLVPADGLLLARYDCRITRRATAGAACRVESLGIDRRADWSARRLSARRGLYRFEIHHHGRPLTQISMQVAGRHNVINALAAAALGWEDGASAEQIAGALSSFRGIRRRLELVGSWRGVSLVDDYAHHPTEVAATLRTLRQMYPGRRVWCVFQPHQVSRTACLLDELADSLQNADRVVVAEIYRAREGPPRQGEVTAADLARRVREVSAAALDVSPTGPEVLNTHSLEEIAQLLQNRLTPGDVLVTMGAGDIRRICDVLVDGIREDRSAG